jgi:septal ring factor EnvC (AmiA/AmiB activator)
MRRSAFTLIFCLLPLAAMAAPSDELAKTKEELKASQARTEKLANQQEEIAKELAILQEKLVRAAAQLQESEMELEEAQKKSQALQAEFIETQKSLANRRTKLDGLARVAIRLSRTPQQAMVLMPADGKNRIQAAHALALITAEIKTQAELIQKEMSELQALQIRVEEDKKKTEKIRTANKQEKKEFEAALKSRKQLQSKLAMWRKEEDAKTAALARKAKSLQELISSLDSESRESVKAAGRSVSSETGVSGRRGDLRSFRDAKGRIRIPASGRVTTDFGSRDGAEVSKGVKIRTGTGATVVAPFDGEVAYSGIFLNYGKLVILKHRGDYHTLLAGLSRIDVKTGDFLLEGEPIGVMDSSEKQLYVELRENNQPINPKGWLRGL